MKSGVVKWFHQAKGYGYIKPEDGSDDVFVFYPSIVAEGFKSLSSGQFVKFESSQNLSGNIEATKVYVS